MRRFILFLAFLLLVATADAQVSSMRFRHLTIDEGLSQNYIRALLQDSQGYIWIGTKDGLNRYDGHEFRIFLNDPFNPLTLNNNQILSLYEDARGMLWIGTATGINVYNRNTEQFARVQLRESLPVEVIAETESGRIWAGTIGAGVAIIDPDSIRNPGYRPQHILDDKPLLRNIRSLSIDGTSVWVGCDRGLFKINVSLETEAFYELYVKAPSATPSPVDSSITKIIDTRDGYLWLGKTSGIIHFRKADGQYEYYPHHYAVFRYGWGTILSMLLEHDANRLWLGTADELMFFDCSQKTYTYLAHDTQNPSGISNGGFLSVLQDQGGLIWLGSNGSGINIHDPAKKGFNVLTRNPPAGSRIKDFSVRAIFEDEMGNHWVSARVLYRWNKTTGHLQSFERGSQDVRALGNTEVWSFEQGKEGWLWMGTHEGLYRYHVQDSIVIHYRHDPADVNSLPEKNVFKVFEDSHGQIWVITRRFIALLNMQTSSFTSWRLKYREGLDDIYFPSVYEDHQGTFWINTDLGLLRFDPVTKQQLYFTTDPANKKSLNNPVVRTICPDPLEPERILWLGTAGGGLNRFDKHTGVFTHLTTENGLPDNVVYGILSDDSGHIWFSTNKGICAYHVNTGRLRKYDQTDGLQSNEFNSGAYFKSESGEMFFGGIKGVNNFFPNDIKENQHIPQIAITAVRVGNQVLNPKDDEEFFSTSSDAHTTLTLSHNHDIISFEYAALDYSAPLKNQYRYKLEGWDSEWIEAGTQRVATYSNLPPGSYTFQVTGSNNDLYWNPKGASLSLHIPPPWYASTLAFIIYGLLVLGAAVALYRYRLGKLKLQYQLELEQLETEQLRQLDTLKSRFFTNISHEFRTPLTLIQSPVQLLRKHVTTAQGQNLLQLIEQNAQRLLGLINEILDLSKLEAGKVKLEVRPGDIITHLRDLTALHDSAVRHMGKTLDFTSFAPGYACIYDHGKVEKIVVNLLSNAIKNTAAGDYIAIQITLDTTSSHNHVIISVSDTGRGIPAGELAYIFTRFFQGENQQGGGSGVGLSLVKELVELMHGTITAESTPGKETIFRFTLPVIPVDTRDTQTETPVINQTTELIHALRTETPDHVQQVMLIVEDSAPIRTLIATAFADSYQILEAADGQVGEQIALEQIPDVIITDLMMPVKDGMAMCDALKKDERTSHIPIVMLTARADTDAMIQGYDTGADAYVVKPFEVEVLKAQTRNLVQTRLVLRTKFSKNFFAGAELPEVEDTNTQWCNRLRTILDTHLFEEDFGIDQLSAAMNMSRRQIQRKCNALFGVPPNEFIRNYRLERAKKLLETRSITVSEVCYAVGFGNLSYFSKCFKEYFNKLPSEVMS